ncbi:MAG: bifunctional [glutamate--ammonia ligase]-adenylyl-L-tyrosine phosphorylase/[glutamate--ammonia-ligase] adenylyltransferase [Betaproteobacteria bacterium]|nr:bifunctional [glutamate--ammonia ligase]-adenylyl-L-tyrosine phosphorylase/[glutamate--ammonia-ligase] adenylyltransferase [Betaproteobacteria bacterium]
MPDPIRKIDFSRVADHWLAAHPALGAELDPAAPAFSAAEIGLALEGATADDEAALRRRLRRLRQRVLLRTMARDLDGRADLAEVCDTMSELSDQAIRCALDWCGRPDLVVVAMGKLGGRELNVSSDIDLVFLHPEDGDQVKLERAGRKLISLLQDIDGDGYVFRVDMRLRPYGGSGPLVASYDALETYFVTQGREWERYAWIKARALTGAPPGAAGPEHASLEAIRRPFVFRKYLDYATLASMRRLHAEVRKDVERRERANDIKLGPGGIREIEFVAQALQLIRGGRDPALMARPTLEVLGLLAERRMLPADAVRELSAAYVFLRSLEHRLQYLDDAQTHLLPTDAEDRRRIALMMDFPDWGAFRATLDAHRVAVTHQFRAVLAESEVDAELPWPEHPRAAQLRDSQRYAQLPEDSRRRVDRVVPLLARAGNATPDPNATLSRGIDLIEAVARRAAYLALLAENPQALERVARIIGASPWAANYVTRHPLLMDELLDDRMLYAPPDWVAAEQLLRTALDAASGDTERQVNLLREHHQSQVFRLLAQDLAGLLTVEKLADHLSELADRVLGVVLEAAWRDVRNRHCEQPRFAVIGYGKLGGKELGYASDLDMVFLFDDPDPRAEENYIRLGQRYNNWLSANTSSGTLFETDLALRPSGSKGLLVSSLAGFEEYQEKSAWVWEHQALTRARFSAGDRQIGAAFEAIRTRILTRERDLPALAKEVLGMRERMHAAHPNPSGLFDLKHDRGGMIDIEFAVQFLVLSRACRHPALTGNLGNIALLGIAADLGLIGRDVAARCQAAYREFRRMQHALRLQGEKFARVPPAQTQAHADAVRELWNAVFPPETRPSPGS